MGLRCVGGGGGESGGGEEGARCVLAKSQEQ